MSVRAKRSRAKAAGKPRPSVIDRSRARSIGRLDKHIDEFTAAINAFGAAAGMTPEEQTAVTSTMAQLSESLWARKKAHDDAERVAHPDEPWARAE